MESINNKSEEELKAEAMAIYEEVIKMPEVSEALELLNSLPENLKYHNKEHTIDVIKETILFALADGESMDRIVTAAIAAAWHDVGFIKSPSNNEPIAVELFKKSKAYQSLSESQKTEIINNILDTQMVMIDDKPHLLMQRSKYGYVLDGDVSNFGREDYFEKRMKVVEELSLDLSKPEVKKKFYAFTLELLRNHEWKTNSARRLRDQQKKINLQKIEEEYARL